MITYLDKIIEKSNNKISKKFAFSKFDTVNIFLINKALNHKYNLWFEADNQHLDKFYEPVIFALCVHYFEMNYCENETIKPQTGDKYKDKNGKTFKVLNIEYDNSRQCEIVKLEGISRGNTVFVSPNLSDIDISYIKLSDEATKNSRTSIKPMLGFLKKTLDITEHPPSFPYKFAIIAQKNEFEDGFKILDKEAFPYTYIADSGTENQNIQLADSQFFVASDYSTIQEYIFDEDIKLEHIIFIGNKYNNQIQQDIDRGYFKQAVFIGEQKPDVDCLKWRWTLSEYQYFNDFSEGKIDAITVKNDILSELIEKFISHVKQIERDNTVDLQTRILPYISYIFSLVIPTESSRLRNRIDDLKYSFKKRVEQVLKDELCGFDVDYTKYCANFVDDYNEILAQFYFENNAKTQELKQLSETNYLLAPERQTLEVWQDEIKKLNWQKVKIISLNGLKKIPKQKYIAVLSIKDYDFYCNLKNSGCSIRWLLYEQEQKQYEGFVRKYDNELSAELNSKDRKKLTDIDYPKKVQEEQTDELINRIFNSKNNKSEYATTYQDHINKKIVFSDDSDVELATNSSVILIDSHNKPSKYKVADLSVDDKIRVYENQHKEILFDELIKQNDDKFNEILDHSKLWKKKLKDYCISDGITQEVATLCRVEFSTVEGWLKKSNAKFPKDITPLENILSDDYRAICNSNRKYNSIMIVLGRDLSDEISDYIMHKTKGKLLGKFDDESIKNISEHNMPIKVIKKIDII
ncbi:MAG: hypothetical protein HRO68_10415 [Nitrosopumilus sp.]|nr:hypothetical protein [Nitrosopumilus sp.]